MAEFDAVISFVLYQTDLDEVRTAVQQALAGTDNVHVVLVDNSVPPLPLDKLADRRVTIITAGKNLGYGAGHNLALRRFTGRAKYHAVLNTDLYFGPEVIPGLIAFMDARPAIGLAMPRVLNADGSIQHLCRLLPRPIDIFARAFVPRSAWAKRLDARYEAHDWNYDSVVSFPFLSGCFMLIPAHVLDRVGLFDERFFLFAEDLDLSRRIHRHYPTVLCPEVHVIHDYRTRSVRSPERRRLQMRSLTEYFNKYGWLFDRERRSMNRATMDALARAHMGEPLADGRVPG